MKRLVTLALMASLALPTTYRLEFVLDDRSGEFLHLGLDQAPVPLTPRRAQRLR